MARMISTDSSEREKVVEDLISIGVLRIEGKRQGPRTFKIPFLYRARLEVRQGSA